MDQSLLDIGLQIIRYSISYIIITIHSIIIWRWAYSKRNAVFLTVPLSQLTPVNPRAHLQRYLFSRSEHVAPFLHGVLLHSLLSEKPRVIVTKLISNIIWLSWMSLCSWNVLYFKLQLRCNVNRYRLIHVLERFITTYILSVAWSNVCSF